MASPYCRASTRNKKDKSFLLTRLLRQSSPTGPPTPGALRQFCSIGAGRGSRTLISCLGSKHNSRYTIPATTTIISPCSPFAKETVASISSAPHQSSTLTKPHIFDIITRYGNQKIQTRFRNIFCSRRHHRRRSTQNRPTINYAYFYPPDH